MKIIIWHHAYPDYADRMAAMLVNVQLLQSGKVPCTLTLTPR